MPRRKRIYGKRRKRVKSPLKFYGGVIEDAGGGGVYRGGDTTGGKILDVAAGPLAGIARRLFKGGRKPVYDHATMGNPANRQKAAPTYNFPASPMQKKGRGWDRLQTGLSVAGTVFPQADALNALVSSGRAGYAALTGDKEGAKKHGKAAAINAAAIVPGVGEITKATKAGKILKASKKANQLTDAAKIKNIGSTGANVAYWKGTGDQVRKDITGGYDKEVPVSVKEKAKFKKNLA